MRLAKMVVGLLALAVLCFAAAYAAAAPFQPRAGAPLARKIVVFSEESTEPERLALAATVGTVIRSLDMIHSVVIEVPASELKDAEMRLLGEKDVMFVEDDARINWISGVSVPAAVALPNRVEGVPLPSVSEVLAQAREDAASTQETPWGIKRVKADWAWRSARGGDGIRVAVIDTGIDRTHPDLAANIKGGWNAIDNSEDFNDDNGHGTHCAGIIAARDNKEGVIGVAPRAYLYGVKVLDAGGSGTFSDVIAGMEWATKRRMDVVSMSLGASQGNEALRRAVKEMRKAGVVLVAAAGNSGTEVGFPAAYPGALAIAAMDVNDQVAEFSSRGPQVAFIGPGVAVKSTYMGGSYATLSGTSMATPHVSGLVALYLAMHDLTMDDLLWKLKRSSWKIKHVPGEQQGAGVLQANGFMWP